MPHLCDYRPLFVCICFCACIWTTPPPPPPRRTVTVGRWTRSTVCRRRSVPSSRPPAVTSQPRLPVTSHPRSMTSHQRRPVTSLWEVWIRCGRPPIRPAAPVTCSCWASRRSLICCPIWARSVGGTGHGTGDGTRDGARDGAWHGALDGAWVGARYGHESAMGWSRGRMRAVWPVCDLFELSVQIFRSDSLSLLRRFFSVLLSRHSHRLLQ